MVNPTEKSKTDSSITTAKTIDTKENELTILVSTLYSNTIQNINISQQNAVDHQRNMNIMLSALMANVASMILSQDPLQTNSATKALTGNQLAEEITNLKDTIQTISDRTGNPQTDQQAPTNGGSKNTTRKRTGKK